MTKALEGALDTSSVSEMCLKLRIREEESNRGDNATLRCILEYQKRVRRATRQEQIRYIEKHVVSYDRLRIH